MKNKIAIGVLALVCVVSVGFNIYLYNVLNASRTQASDTQAQLDSMTNDYADLGSQVAAMQEELDSLRKENETLTASVSEMAEEAEARAAAEAAEKAEAERLAKEAADAEKVEAEGNKTNNEQASTGTGTGTGTQTTDTGSDFKNDLEGWQQMADEDGVVLMQVPNGGEGRDMSGFTGGNWQ